MRDVTRNSNDVMLIQCMCVDGAGACTHATRCEGVKKYANVVRKDPHGALCPSQLMVWPGGNIVPNFFQKRFRFVYGT